MPVEERINEILLYTNYRLASSHKWNSTDANYRRAAYFPKITRKYACTVASKNKTKEEDEEREAFRGVTETRRTR